MAKVEYIPTYKKKYLNDVSPHLDKKFNLISESRGSKCKLVCNYNQLLIKYSYKLKNNEKIHKELNVNEFIDVKGYKSIGKRLDNKLHMSGFKFEKIVSESNLDDSNENYSLNKIRTFSKDIILLINKDDELNEKNNFDHLGISIGIAAIRSDLLSIFLPPPTHI